MRIEDDVQISLDWTQKFYEATYQEILANPLANLNELRFITTSTQSEEQLLSIGRYRGKGSVMNFNKSDGVVKWHAEFENVSAINAHAQDFESDELFICGHWQPDEASLKYTGVIARMMSDGEVEWLRTISGINPDTSVERANVDQDLCKGISYDPIQSNLAVLI